MKELYIAYHTVTGELMLRDAHSLKYTQKFKSPDELLGYFMKDKSGITIKNRGRVNIVVDLDNVVDEVFKNKIKETMQKIDWAKKTNIEYKKIRDFYI